eukprot:TRINITY_DN3162_c0_g1_i1.p1 TRINITY_DN3162_c0_g1~~TRINITY_DN3162_c0_g1_i1.p1  ORF type:complete len:253 (-),score=40.13 TRINITY_DN3162_c0_g1_i1:50-772(-)
MSQISVSSISGHIDHALLQPNLTDAEFRKGCEVAKRLGVAAVCVKPYQVAESKELLKGSSVAVCAVIGFPHGNSSTQIKVLETEDVIKNGASEVDMVVNVGKVLSGDWEYVENEIRAVVNVTKKHKVILKVIFENDYLPNDAHKIRLCQICSKLKVEFVKTSTGFGFVKQPDGNYNYAGATEHDLKLMRHHSAPEVQIKASGGVRNLDTFLKVRDIGVSRIGTSSTEAIVQEAQKRFSKL